MSMKVFSRRLIAYYWNSSLAWQARQSVQISTHRVAACWGIGTVPVRCRPSGVSMIPSSYTVFPTRTSPPLIASMIVSRMQSTKPKDADNKSEPKERESADNDSQPTDNPVEDGKKLTSKERLKIITTQYGAFGMAFHITISLASLGFIYFLVYSGVDVTPFMTWLGVESTAITAGASTLIIAYAVHKVFAPVRIAVTFVSVPILVRYLRKIGFFKKR